MRAGACGGRNAASSRESVAGSGIRSQPTGRPACSVANEMQTNHADFGGTGQTSAARRPDGTARNGIRRHGAIRGRRSHNPEVAGSNPARATKPHAEGLRRLPDSGRRFVLQLGSGGRGRRSDKSSSAADGLSSSTRSLLLTPPPHPHPPCRYSVGASVVSSARATASSRVITAPSAWARS
jgi:hypothetical protein